MSDPRELDDALADEEDGDVRAVEHESSVAGRGAEANHFPPWVGGRPPGRGGAAAASHGLAHHLPG